MTLQQTHIRTPEDKPSSIKRLIVKSRHLHSGTNHEVSGKNITSIEGFTWRFPKPALKQTPKNPQAVAVFLIVGKGLNTSCYRF
jgi:hypothetical protein